MKNGGIEHLSVYMNLLIEQPCLHPRLFGTGLLRQALPISRVPGTILPHAPGAALQGLLLRSALHTGPRALSV